VVLRGLVVAQYEDSYLTDLAHVPNKPRLAAFREQLEIRSAESVQVSSLVGALRDFADVMSYSCTVVEVEQL
jgi:hypothetical protein